jgi:hypothetical protein
MMPNPRRLEADHVFLLLSLGFGKGVYIYNLCVMQHPSSTHLKFLHRLTIHMKSQLEILTADLNSLEKRIRKGIKRFTVLTHIRTNSEFDYQNFLFLKILTKLESVIRNVKRNKSNLLLLASTVRFLFETLIQLELVKKEPKHIYILLYSIYNHQVTKTNKLYEELKSNLLVLDKIIELREQLIKYIETPTNTKKNKLVYTKHINQEIADILLSRTYIFLAHIDKIEPTEVRKILMEIYMPKYEKLIDDLANEKKHYAKEIIKKPFITNLFDFKNQFSKVFTQFKDTRSWSDKAKEVGLLDDYIYMYDYTSSLIHSTSYSLITSPNIDDEEIGTNLIFIRQYLLLILNNFDRHLLSYNLKALNSKS